MKTVILAGGAGTRMGSGCGLRPKPLAEIGGKPILWHILQIYRSHGFREFIIAGGAKWHALRDYCACLDDHDIKVVDTGPDTMTGGRLLRIRELLAGESDFMMTYGDGVANVDLKGLLDFHRQQGRLATLTAVNPPSPFGRVHFDGDRIACFEEKKPQPDSWINGGFFVLSTGIFDYLKDDRTIFESEPLERLAESGQLVGYRHPGFWKCMDTPKDLNELNDLWAAGTAPWKAGWDGCASL